MENLRSKLWWCYGLFFCHAPCKEVASESKSPVCWLISHSCKKSQIFYTERVSDCKIISRSSSVWELSKGKKTAGTVKRTALHMVTISVLSKKMNSSTVPDIVILRGEIFKKILNFFIFYFNSRILPALSLVRRTSERPNYVLFICIWKKHTDAHGVTFLGTGKRKVG